MSKVLSTPGKALLVTCSPNLQQWLCTHTRSQARMQSSSHGQVRRAHPRSSPTVWQPTCPCVHAAEVDLAACLAGPCCTLALGRCLGLRSSNRQAGRHTGWHSVKEMLCSQHMCSYYVSCCLGLHNTTDRRGRHTRQHVSRDMQLLACRMRTLCTLHKRYLDGMPEAARRRPSNRPLLALSPNICTCCNCFLLGSHPVPLATCQTLRGQTLEPWTSVSEPCSLAAKTPTLNTLTPAP
jgi:hypothetical protein